MVERVFGTIPPFDMEKSEWIMYKGQINQAFKTFKVKDDEKVGFLLTYCGPQLSSLIYNIFCPKDPGEEVFDSIVKELDKYFCKPTNVFTERKLFYECKQADGESSQDFMLRLKRMAAKCNFKDDQRDMILRDKFITSLSSSKIFDRLCDESDDVSLAKVLEIVRKYESKFEMKTMEMDVHAVSSYKKNQLQQKKEVHNKVQSSKGSNCKNGTSNNPRENGNERKKPCLHCGWTNHLAVNCKYKECICNTCGQKGHLSKICGNVKNKNKSQCTNCKENKSEEIDFVDEIYSNFLINNVENDFDKPIEIELIIYDRKIKFLVDTGAQISAIPFKLYKDYFQRFRLLNNNVNKAKSYGGHVLEIKGTLKVPINFNNVKNIVEFFVIENGQRPIIGRSFLREFNLKQIEINNIVCEKEKLNNLIDNYNDIFSNKLGLLKNVKVSLEVVENVKPIFIKARKIPYSFVESVEEELIKLEHEGVIEKVESAEWGSPLVPVLKENGKIRICTDYKVTINKFLKDTNYPLPRIDDIIIKLTKSRIFSKLDLSRAYNQIEMCEDSKLMLTWSTHLGNFKMNRLPFGVKPATGIFQREMDRILTGIKGVSNFLDDIVVYSVDMKSHLLILEQVLKKLSDNGLILNKNKCEFGKSEISYLGYKISYGSAAKTGNNDAILMFPEPKSVTDVKSFCGLANYFGKNIPNLATKLSPIYNLLKKGVNFDWNEECHKSMIEIKNAMVSDHTMMKFNPDLELVLTCDASAVGVGAVLSHKLPNGEEKAIEFASRILNKAEKNYGVIEKEALAIIFGTKNFFQYLIGRKFTLKTDHKPLLTIFGNNKSIPQMSTSRLQRWAVHLSAFNYEIEYVKSEKNCADGLSRCPVDITERQCNEDSFLNLILTNKDVPIDYNMVVEETKTDQCLQEVISALFNNSMDALDKKRFGAFISKKSELFVEKRILMWGFRAIIPEKLRGPLLRQIHNSHLGIVKTKSIVRSYVWWPCIDRDIENLIKNCEACMNTLSSPPKSKVIPWEEAERPFSRIHVDFAGPLNDLYYFIVVDSYSKWIEVSYTKTPNSKFCIRSLSYIFARFGIPDKLVSDNGPQLVSEEFESFLRANGIEHIRTAPYFPATNGAAENAVKTVKYAIKNASHGKTHIDADKILCDFLTDYRNSIHCATKQSPVSKLFSYTPKIKLDLIFPKIGKSKSDVKYEAETKKSRIFNKLENVLIRTYRGNKISWSRGQIINILGPRMFECKLSDGKVIKRHLDQIRKCMNNDKNPNNFNEKNSRRKILDQEGNNLNRCNVVCEKSRNGFDIEQSYEDLSSQVEDSNQELDHSCVTTSGNELIIDDTFSESNVTILNRSGENDTSYEEYVSLNEEQFETGLPETEACSIPNLRFNLRDRSKIKRPSKFSNE